MNTEQTIDTQRLDTAATRALNERRADLEAQIEEVKANEKRRAVLDACDYTKTGLAAQVGVRSADHTPEQLEALYVERAVAAAVRKSAPRLELDKLTARADADALFAAALNGMVAGAAELPARLADWGGFDAPSAARAVRHGIDRLLVAEVAARYAAKVVHAHLAGEADLFQAGKEVAGEALSRCAYGAARSLAHGVGGGALHSGSLYDDAGARAFAKAFAECYAFPYREESFALSLFR